MMRDDSLVSIGVFEVDEDPEDELDKPGTTIGTKFSVLQGNPNPVFDEMWLLTIDPFIGIFVFIAKLSKRQYCWRVFENLHSKEHIQFFDITLLPLHASCTSPLAVMPMVGLLDFVKVSISESLKSFFANHVH